MPLPAVPVTAAPPVTFTVVVKDWLPKLAAEIPVPPVTLAEVLAVTLPPPTMKMP